MLLQTRKVEFDGFDRIQEILMRVKLANIRITTENVKITLHQCIEYGKCNYCWYGGLIATIVCGDNQFDLMANGDVIVHLLDKKTNEVLAYVKDKSNDGSFYDRMQAYIANDAHLEAIMADDDPDYTLDFENNNWFEVFLIKVDDQITDNSYISDCENVFDAIAEMVEKITEMKGGIVK